MKLNKGFTLIELLVVIAIIGILSSVVLASLNSARDKGKDAAVQTSMASMRSEAELVFTAAGSYPADLCTRTAGSEGALDTLMDAVETSGGADVDCGDDGGNAWAVAVTLPSGTSPDKTFCVDSTGYAGEPATSVAPATETADYVCDGDGV